jgi:glutamyl-tRNA synthetase
MNGKYLSSVSTDRILHLLPPFVEEKSWIEDPLFPKRVELMRTRAVTLRELVDSLAPYYRDDFAYDAAALEKSRKDSALVKLLDGFTSTLPDVTVWNHSTLEAHLRDFMTQRGVKAGVLIHPIRLSLTGKTMGPGLFEVMEVMGKENTIARLRRFVQELSIVRTT